MLVKSISYDEKEIIQNIIDLHCGGKDIELDPTYSKGNFYKNKINPPKHKFDKYPQTDGVEYSDVVDLPFDDESFSIVMFDPPFLATRGPSLKVENGSNIINRRFTVFQTEKDLHVFYIDALHELYRILKPDGILIFKCQDKVSSGKQYFSHCFVHDQAIKIGFYPKDMFVLLAKNRVISGKHGNQMHARKFHSYFWVLEKSNKNVWDKIIN
jgi:SAM-dependent methyltransferase